MRELHSFQLAETESWRMSLVMIVSGCEVEKLGQVWHGSNPQPRELRGFKMNLLAKKDQIAEEKLHSKNRWSWDSRAELHKTHVAGIDIPQCLSLSLVRSLPRNASQVEKANRGTASLNQTTLLQGTKGEWERSYSQVALAEKIRDEAPVALHHKNWFIPLYFHAILENLTRSWLQQNT